MIRSPLLALALALACTAGAALAQSRPIPADAKRGAIRHLQEMLVEINGQTMRLAPGAQIRDAANRVVVPAAVPAGVVAKYTLNAQGHVQRVWILTPFEAAQPDPKK